MLGNIQVVETATYVVGDKKVEYFADVYCPQCNTLVETERLFVKFESVRNDEMRLHEEESLFRNVEWCLGKDHGHYWYAQHHPGCKKPEPWQCNECGILFVLNRRGREQLLELWKTRKMLARLE